MRKISLVDGTKIAIIGGGPAGSFFAHFIAKYAREKRIQPVITIFDGKNFSVPGPKGCNLCAGVISDSLRLKLEQEEISLPEGRIVNRLDGYCIHGDDHTLQLKCEDNNSDKINAVFRGNGPRFSTFPEVVSFDDFLLARAQDFGANIISQPVTDIRCSINNRDPITLFFEKNSRLSEFHADFVIGAFGVNTFFIKKLQALGFGFKPPSTQSIYQAEMKLGRDEVQKKFGNVIHVYMQKSINLRYASIVPKDEYISITLIGKKDATQDLFNEFLKLKDIRAVLSPAKPQCFCYPRIVTTASKKPYTDRLVIIGDAAFSRHYKNGMESAFLTARLSAHTAVAFGIDSASFAEHYNKTAKKLIKSDNFYGKLLFKINHFISSVPLITRAHFILAENQPERKSSKNIRSILWNMLTGNIPYKEVFRSSLSLRLHLALLLTVLKLFYHDMKDKLSRFKL